MKKSHIVIQALDTVRVDSTRQFPNSNKRNIKNDHVIIKENDKIIYDNLQIHLEKD